MPADIPILKSVINSGSISDALILIEIFVILQTFNLINLKHSIMKTKSIIATVSMLFILTSLTTYAQKADFSGEWKINKEKSSLADNQLFLSRITIKLKSDSLLTTRVYENGNGEEYPFEENLSLDSKECKINIYEMPRTSTATRSDANGPLMIASTTTFNGNNGQEDMVAKETWKVENDGQVLSMAFTNKMSGNETTGTYYYNKLK
jgi:antitoxin component YwqK of YwqJK toxin-antitoxin module